MDTARITMKRKFSSEGATAIYTLIAQLKPVNFVSLQSNAAFHFFSWPCVPRKAIVVVVVMFDEEKRRI